MRHLSSTQKNSDSTALRSGGTEGEVDWPINTRILLVEDNPTNQIVAQGMLETMGLYADIAANGLEAIASIKLATTILPYSIVLMDCQMPEMDGYDATRAIRSGEAGESNKGIPVVAMTANAMAGDREKCMVAGMDDYIAKPINIVTLKETLMKWLLAHEVHENEIVSDKSSFAPTQECVLWDEKDALGRMGGNGELLNKIIGSFVSDGKKIITALEYAINEQRMSDAQLHAHSLKGSAGNVGALKLQGIAKDLERAASNHELSVLQDGYAQCAAVFSATLQLLEDHLHKTIKTAVKKKRMDPLDMAIKLQAIKQDLEKSIFIDTDALGIFTEYTQSGFSDNMKALKECIDQFETTKALDMIEQIVKEL